METQENNNSHSRQDRKNNRPLFEIKQVNQVRKKKSLLSN